MAKKLSRNVIAYYGVSGHRKGLVDAMSAFGVKNLIQRAVWVEDFSYKKAVDIYNYLTQHFDQDTQKNYGLIDQDEISVFQSKKKSLKIKGCRSFHMICYHSDGSIEIKINFCSCENCLIGDFVNCIDEKGTFIPAKRFDNEPSDSESSESEDESDDDYDDDGSENDEEETTIRIKS